MTRLTALLLCAAACNSGPPPAPLVMIGDTTDCGAVFFRTTPSALPLTGQAFTFKVSSGFSCDTTPVTSQVVITGPDTNEVPVQLGTNGRDDDLGNFVEVTFTPLAAGPHHFAARFLPNLGVVQFDLDVVAVRDVPPVKVTAPELASCFELEVFPSGRVACLSSPAAVYEVASGVLGAAVQLPYASKAFRVGDTLWVLSADGLLARWRDGATFAPAPANGVLVGADATVLPTRDDAVVLAGARVLYVHERAEGALTADDQNVELAMTHDRLTGWRSGAAYGAYSWQQECEGVLGGALVCSAASAPGGESPIALSEAGAWTQTFGTRPTVTVRKRTALDSLTVSPDWRVLATGFTYGVEPLLQSGYSSGIQYAIGLTSDNQLIIESYGDVSAGHLISVTHSTASRYDAATHTLSLYRR